MKSALLLTFFVVIISLGSSTEVLAKRSGNGARNAITLATELSAGKTFCSNKTLKGTYTYSTQGSSGGSPFAEAGMETYDGNGNIAGLGSSSDSQSNQPYAGTYTINSDCSGTLVYSGDIRYNIYIKPDGISFTYIDTSAGSVLVGEEKIATKQLMLK